MVKNMYSRTCRECGNSFVGGPRSWFCQICGEERRRKQSIVYRQRIKEGKTRKLGTIDICQNCGKEYMVNGGLQKYCAKCAPEAVAEIDRRQGMEYYAGNKEEINSVKMVERRKLVLCEKCGEVISVYGGRRFCLKCENIAKKEMYAYVYIERGIHKRGSSYIVKCNFECKSYFIKSTTDYDTAIKMRDYAEIKSKLTDFKEWLEKYRNDGRPIDMI